MDRRGKRNTKGNIQVLFNQGTWSFFSFSFLGWLVLDSQTGTRLQPLWMETRDFYRLLVKIVHYLLLQFRNIVYFSERMS